MKFGANIERLQFNKMLTYQREEASASNYPGFPNWQCKIFRQPCRILTPSARLTKCLPGSSSRTSGVCIPGNVESGFAIRIYLGPHGKVGQNRPISALCPRLKTLRYRNRGPLLEGIAQEFCPRLRISWDPLGQGQLVVRAGAGIFHEQIMSTTLPRLTRMLPSSKQQPDCAYDTVPFPN
jgi:hypothetical protein